MFIEQKQKQENSKDLFLYRKLMIMAGAIYLLWWFAVEAVLPEAYNPFLSRILVVLFIFLTWSSSFLNEWARRHVRVLFVAGAWLITLHYYYLFYYNAGDANWIFGSYITVIAINLSLLSSGSLLAYSVFVVVLSMLMVIAIPSMGASVFLPGLITIVFQANIGLRSRFQLIKNLTESNERFQMLFNSTFEGVIVHQEGRTIDINDSLLQLLGCTRDEMIGKDAFNVIHPDEREFNIQKMRSGNITPYETKVITKSGQSIDVELRGKDFIYNKTPARLVTIQDIRDRKRAEKERVAALTLAENVRVRDEFISIASHELKTPLAAIHLQLQLIDRDLKEDVSKLELSKKLKEAMALFDRQILRLSDLVEAMLDVSRISSGRFLLNLTRVNLSVVVKEVIATLPYSPIEVEAGEDLFVTGDATRLYQVVENLLTNAIKYGEGKLIQMRVYREGNEVVLAVEDHGMGIPADYIDRIFDRFERAVSASNISGFGLGLYITRKIVEAHGGQISVRSAPHVGSIFTVRLKGIE